MIAPPGAHMVTPRSPSIVGPLLDHVYGVPGSFSLVEYRATIISGETYAPTPNMLQGKQFFYFEQCINEIMFLFRV